jgi:carbonic anhydrase
MDRLLNGYQRFRRDRWPERRRQFEKLAELGQQPRALVISCADSRVDPAVIFDAGPGELFVVRNVANLVPPYAPDGAYHGTSAALEFAVRVLKVPEIIVLGHALCGGVRALLEGTPPEAADFVGPWIGLAARARDRALARGDQADRQLCCEQETVGVSIENLRSFPWIAGGLTSGALRLWGMHFDIRSGQLSLRGDDGCFGPVADAAPGQDDLNPGSPP